MTAKEQYRQLCETEGIYIPLFQQYWWMETVCAGKRWDVLLVEKSGEIVGALPFLIGSKFGFKYVLQPQLTQYNGPWLSEGLNFSERQTVMSELADRLKGMHLALYSQCFPPSVSDWLPFYWAGFKQTTRYTYRFPDISSPTELMGRASRARRQNLDDVASVCVLDADFRDVALFAAMHEAYFRRKGMRDVLSRELIERVCRTAIEREQGRFWALRNADGEVVHVSFVVFDSRCAYALMSAISDKAPRNSQTYLFWRIIEQLSSVTRAFDFEGSMERGNEYFYRSFGTVQTPYHCIYRSRIPFGRRILGV